MKVPPSEFRRKRNPIICVPVQSGHISRPHLLTAYSAATADESFASVFVMDYTSIMTVHEPLPTDYTSIMTVREPLPTD